METSLNITKLIEAAEGLVYDDRIVMAAAGEWIVQEIEIEGKIFQLKVVLTRIDNEEEQGDEELL